MTIDKTNKKITVRCGRFGVNESNTGRGTPGLVWGSHVMGYFDSYTTNRPFIGGALIPMILFDSRGTWCDPFQITGETIATGDGTTVDFKTAFPFVTEIEVFVNGVSASPDDYTFDYSVPETNSNIGRYFIRMFNNPNDMAGNYIGTAPYGFTDASNDPYCDSSAAYPSSASTENSLSVEKANRIYFSAMHRSYWYNPYYVHGIASIGNAQYGTPSVQCSNDFETWTTVSTGTIPEQYRNYKYWSVGGSTGAVFNAPEGGIRTTNIHFVNPPTEGSVITATYKTKAIPKDVNHVFDFEFSMTFGEPEDEDSVQDLI